MRSLRRSQVPGSSAGPRAAPSQQGPRAEDLLLAAEAGAPVPAGMGRCVVLGGGFSGSGEEFGLLRVRTPRAERDVTEHHAIPCSINPWNEVGILRLPQRAESPPAAVLEEVPRFDWKKRMADEEAKRRQEYEAEIERRLRFRLAEKEKQREAENSEKLAALFNRLGAKWGTIQEEKIAARRREVGLAQFELQKHERRRREQAATKIQSWWHCFWERRRYKVRLHAHHKRQMEERMRKHMIKRRARAAIDIQRIWRGWMTHRRYRELRVMKREDWLARRLRQNLLWLTMQASQKEDLRKQQRQAIKNNRRIIVSTRAVVRIQAWYRGWKARQQVKRARLFRMRPMDNDVDDLERLRRIQREAQHTSTELTDHKDMTMVNRALGRRDIEDHERLTEDLRKVREVARAVEADLVRESELEIVPLRELSDFLEAKQLRADRDRVRRDADAQGAETMRAATMLERDLQQRIDAKEVAIDLSRLRYEARRIQQDMTELTDGAEVWGRLQDFRRDLHRPSATLSF